MEPTGAFSSGEWDPLAVHFSNEDLDLAQRLLGQHPSANQLFAEVFADQIPAMFENAMFGSEVITPNPNSSQDSSYYSVNDNIACGFYVPNAATNVDQYSGGYNCYYDQMQVMSEVSVPIEETDPFLPDYSGIVTGDGLDQIQSPGDHQAVPEVPLAEKPQLKRKSKAAISDFSTVEEDDSNGKPKNPRVSRDKSKKNSQPRRKQKTRLSDLNEDEESNGRQEGQTSSMCSSEDEFNGESALNSDGKPRASRGPATDPQSLYARKRRERINERLKVLQNLVPNGTKVDISTMLEEAVQYVKFLQLQIKLLSSDDMWIYAPIAYNGMDIGLNQILHRL